MKDLFVVESQENSNSKIFNVENILVGTADVLRDVLGKIQQMEQTEFVITLTADIVEANFVGLVGKHIILQSNGDNKFTIGLGRELLCDLTFDTVIVKTTSLYCNGYKTIFTENSELKTEGTIFGGGNQKDVDSTYLVIRGKSTLNISCECFVIVAGGYKSNVRANTYLEICGEIMYGKSDEKEHYIIGGSISSKLYDKESTVIGGDVDIVIDVLPIETEFISVCGTCNSRIVGNLNLTIKSGYFQDICAQKGLPATTQINGNSHLIIGHQNYEGLNRVVRFLDNGNIYGAGNQTIFKKFDFPEMFYRVGGNVIVETFENLWSWQFHDNKNLAYSSSLYGAFFGDVAGDVIINVHGSHLHDLYGACESEIGGNIYVNAVDAELDTRGIQDSLLPLSDRDGGSIFVAQSSSCKSVIVNIDGGSMYQVDLSSLYIEKHEILNITRSPSIRKGIYGDRRYCKTKNKVMLNIDNISVDSPQIQFFSNINLNE